MGNVVPMRMVWKHIVPCFLPGVMTLVYVLAQMAYTTVEQPTRIRDIVWQYRAEGGWSNKEIEEHARKALKNS